MHVCVCVCVSERERERARERACEDCVKGKEEEEVRWVGGVFFLGRGHGHRARRWW